MLHWQVGIEAVRTRKTLLSNTDIVPLCLHGALFALFARFKKFCSTDEAGSLCGRIVLFADDRSLLRSSSETRK
jgi:hypothetical protein